MSEPCVVLKTDYRDYYDAAFMPRAARSPGTVGFAHHRQRLDRDAQFRILTDAGIPCLDHGTARRIAACTKPSCSLIVNLPAGRRHRVAMISAAFAARRHPTLFAGEFILEAMHGIGPVSYRPFGNGAVRMLFRCAGLYPFESIRRSSDGPVQMREPAHRNHPTLYRLSFPFPLWQVSFVSAGERLLAIGFTASPCRLATELFKVPPPARIHREIRDRLLGRRDRNVMQPQSEMAAGGAR